MLLNILVKLANNYLFKRCCIKEVLEYLEHYCTHFDLEKFIRFRTHVELVEPVTKNGREKWRVISRTNGALVRL